MTILINKIVTRGLGPIRSVPQNSGLVAQGYGTKVPAFVVDAFERSVRRSGRSGADRRRLDQLEEVIIWAKLIEVNGRGAPPPVVQGQVRVSLPSPSSASIVVEYVASRSRSAWEFIKVSARRLR